MCFAIDDKPNLLLAAGITLACPGPNEITVTGIDKVLVGQTAADIRTIRILGTLDGK